MIKRPLVSVLVPVYNHERFVYQCLDSIRDCGYPRLELIIIDDGSTDTSFQLVQEWVRRNENNFERILALQQSNRGIPATFNRLISLSQGDLITFIASDDYLLRGGIDVRVALLERHPKLGAVFADCVVVNEQGAQVHASGLTGLHRAYKPALQHSAFRARELAIRWSVPGPVFLARRWVYQDSIGVGLYDERLPVEDRDFYLRLLAQGLLGFVDIPVAAYRLVHSSASRSPQQWTRLREALAATEEKHLTSFRGLARLGIWLRWRIERIRCANRGPQWLRAWKTKPLFYLLSVLYAIHRLDTRIRGVITRD